MSTVGKDGWRISRMFFILVLFLHLFYRCLKVFYRVYMFAKNCNLYKSENQIVSSLSTQSSNACIAGPYEAKLRSMQGPPRGLQSLPTGSTLPSTPYFLPRDSTPFVSLLLHWVPLFTDQPRGFPLLEICSFYTFCKEYFLHRYLLSQLAHFLEVFAHRSLPWPPI